MLIIGFGNKARHGKDTAAEAVHDFYESRNTLLRKHGMTKAITNVGVYKFATALYEESNEALKNGIWKTRTVCYTEKLVNGQCEHFVVLPEWVQPSPEYQPTELAPYGKHPKLLQWWGTEFRRKQNENYWVDKLFASISSNIDVALITDVRFGNEADSIVSRGGYTVNVTRLDEYGQPYRSTDRSPDHPSEIALDSYNWQFRLINHNGHRALLGEQAITLVEYLRGLRIG